jgi:hypothetical protein
MVKPLWVRALANRAYWDRYQIAQEGFRAQARLKAKIEYSRAYDKKRGSYRSNETSAQRTARTKRHRQKTDIRLKIARVAPPIERLENEVLAQCVVCRAPLEKRPGVAWLVHAGPACLPTVRKLPRFVKTSRCTSQVLFRGKMRQCASPSGLDGVCTFHRLKKALGGQR